MQWGENRVSIFVKPLYFLYAKLVGLFFKSEITNFLPNIYYNEKAKLGIKIH